MIVCEVPPIDAILIDHLKGWNPDLDPTKLKFLQQEPVTWNDGSLGCPLPGKTYTQALIDGWRIWLQYDSLILEIHTDRLMQRFAMPGIGFF